VAPANTSVIFSLARGMTGLPFPRTPAKTFSSKPKCAAQSCKKFRVVVDARAATETMLSDEQTLTTAAGMLGTEHQHAPSRPVQATVGQV